MNDIGAMSSSSTEGRVGREKLRVNIPVAQVEGDFRMEPGHEANIGRKCETDIEVLEYGEYQGCLVTKVLPMYCISDVYD
jgi:hypothetical protein